MLLWEWLHWGYLYLQHTLVMMYWVVIPGFLLSGFLNVRYRRTMLDGLLRSRGLRSLFYAIGLGMLRTASRRASLETWVILLKNGIPPASAMAYLVASSSLGFYLLVLVIVLIGLEFGLGVFLGGLAMIALMGAIASLLPASLWEEAGAGPSGSQAVANRGESGEGTTWKALLFSARGWGTAVKDIGHAFKSLWLSSLWGLLLGSFLLALDNTGWWWLPPVMGGEGMSAALASAFLTPFLAIVSFVSPWGNLFVAASLWRTWTVAYPGILSFVLASPLHPLSARFLVTRTGRQLGWVLAIALFFSAAFGGLAVMGLFELLGLRVTHVPWFEPLVRKLIIWFPFTMLGMGGRRGMPEM